MEKAVDEVISRLAEIEDTANRMNDAVEVRKKEISAEMEARTKDFDETLSADTNKKTGRAAEQAYEGKRRSAGRT